MQIELVAPSSEDSTYLPRMGLGILAALTGPDDEVLYTDDLVKPFDIERDLKDVDLVGISVDSKTARRSYEIATAYRRRGTKVVLGGIHPTAVPDEAARFADAVVVGEAEDSWPELLRDAHAGTLKPRYGGPRPQLGGRPFARRDLFRSKKYIPFQVVQTMRGCPFTCEFCSVSTANGTTMRFRPIADVLAETAQLGPRLLFADDNVMVQKSRSAELFDRLVEQEKTWVGQCSLAAVRQLENVELMAKSGCKALFIGFESIDDLTLRQMGKSQNRASEYHEIISMLHDHGIATWGSFVFGFDADDSEVFERTAQFAIDAQLTMASFSILTPYPGTKLYQRLSSEGRLTDSRWWLRRNHDVDSPYFVPATMTREALHEGWQRAWQAFYKPSAIWKRWTVRGGSSWVQTLGFLPLNLMQNRLVKRKIVGGEQRFRSGEGKHLDEHFDTLLRERIAELDAHQSMGA